MRACTGARTRPDEWQPNDVGRTRRFLRKTRRENKGPNLNCGLQLDSIVWSGPANGRQSEGEPRGRKDARQRRWKGEGGGRSLDAASLLGRCSRIGPDHWGFFGKANQSAAAGPETQRRGSSLPHKQPRSPKIASALEGGYKYTALRYAFSAAAGLIGGVSQMMIIHSGR